MATITEEDIKAEFEVFDVEISDQAIIEKLKMICLKQKLGAVSIVEEWMAHSACEIELSLKSLEEFNTKLASDHKNKYHYVKSEARSVKSYNKENIGTLITDQDVNMLEIYQTPEQKKSMKRFHTTPESSNKMLHTSFGRTPAFSPASLSTPLSETPSKRYEARVNAGEIVATFNPNGLPVGNIVWKGKHDVQIEHVKTKPLAERFKYMFQKILDKSQVLNERIDKMAFLLKETYNIEEYESAAVIHQDEVSVVGRISCDTNGKLNASSLLLQESGGKTNFGACVPLSVSDVAHYSLFPGKVVAARGKNPTGKQFIASSFYEELLPLPANPKTTHTDSLTGFIAVGPFTTSESDSYEPLNDFLHQVMKEQPDVVVMMGPFVDAKNDLIEKCEIHETFHEMFSRKMNEIGECARRSSTKFVIIPSQRDVHHDWIYPQPPFCAEDIKNTLYSMVVQVYIKLQHQITPDEDTRLEYIGTQVSTSDHS